jgi:iron-sulfur cluster repair protein YtfE (RIC family)
MESLVEISNYIVNTFHKPIKELLIPTQVLAQKVARVHGERHK